MNDIVVGADRSRRARRALLVATEIAQATGANLHVVTCVDKAKPVAMDVGSDSFHADPIAEARQVLSSLTNTLPYDKVTTAVESGDPAKTLCAEAERLGASMIVVGNKRVQGAARVLGSVAGDVLKHAPCHVLVADTVGDED